MCASIYHAPTISLLLDNSQAVRAEVIALQVSDDPWKRVGLAVYLGG